MSWGQSIPALLRERAQQGPDRPAFTYIDYEVDPAGYADTVTWWQVLRRTESVAAEVAAVASPGDRIALLAPQGLEYIAGFFGAMEPVASWCRCRCLRSAATTNESPRR